MSNLLQNQRPSSPNITLPASESMGKCKSLPDSPLTREIKRSDSSEEEQELCISRKVRLKSVEFSCERPVSPYQGFRIGKYATKGGEANLLGKGAFSDVYRAQEARSGRTVAIKVVHVDRLPDMKHLKQITTEIEILKGLDHPNIVKLYDSGKLTDQYVYLVMEYAEGGDLERYLQLNGPLSETKAKKFMKHIVKGLQYLHSNNIIHRDIKPMNLLLSTKDADTSMLKFGDFGLSRYLAPNELAETICGSPVYAAPEIMKGGKYSFKVDIYSVGVILHEMLIGSPPELDSNLPRFCFSTFTQRTVQLPDRMNEMCKDLIRSLLKDDPYTRLSLPELLNHPWMIET